MDHKPDEMAVEPTVVTRRGWLRGWAIAVAILLLLACAAGVWVVTGGLWRMSFDSAVWKATPATMDDHSVRQRIVDSLLWSGVLMGKTRGDVEALLGPARDTPYFSEYDMVYVLGPERQGLFRIDSEWLVIRLDGAGRVSEARLAAD